MEDVASIYQQSINKRDYERLRTYIEETCGIRMPPSKIQMIEARLKKRLRELRIPTFKDYLDYVFGSGDGHDELLNMIDSLTTNTTSFFREPNHFRVLVERILPCYLEDGGRYPIRFWSAGCSTGEEPYTIAMIMSEYLSHGGQVDFSIEATDISTRVLNGARQAIYPEDRIEFVSADVRRKYFLRSKNREKREVRLKPEIRQKVRFRRLNFMDEAYDFGKPFDFVFFRNVMIYFDRETQGRILEKIIRQIRPGGFLFLGHSETLNGMNLKVIPFAPTIYRKVG